MQSPWPNYTDYGSRHTLNFLLVSYLRSLWKIPLNFDQMFIWVWRYVEPSSLSCHSLYNKMLHKNEVTVYLRRRIIAVLRLHSCLSRGRIPLAILLYEQFIHLTQITLRPNIQLLSNPQHAYQDLRVNSWFDTVSNIVTRWVNFRKKTVAWTWLTIIWLQYLEVFLPKCTNFW